MSNLLAARKESAEVANFLKPGWEPAASFAPKPNGLAYVYVPRGVTREVALWGGKPDGQPLWVQLNDFDSAHCPARCTEQSATGETYRVFTITPRKTGHTMLEARLGGRNGPVWDHVQVVVEESVSWGARVSRAFKAKTFAICRRLNLEPDYLMAAMAFETGTTFSPHIRNRQSQAVGLIQFTAPAARLAGTSQAALAGMSALAQLEFVERYMAFRIAQSPVGALLSLEDVYMAILFPAAIGRPNAHVLFRRGSIEYRQNRGLDTDHDGAVTKAEAAIGVRSILARGRLRGLLG
jgi:hypothetical protein